MGWEAAVGVLLGHYRRVDPLASRRDAPLPAYPHAVAVRHARPLRQIVVAIVVPEFLGRERVLERGDHGPVSHVAHIAVRAHLDGPPPPALCRGEGALGALVGEPVAGAYAQLAPLAPAPQHDAGPAGEPLDPVGVHQIREAADAEAVGPDAGAGAPPGEFLILAANPLEVVATHRLGHVLERGGERLGPRKRVALRLGEKGDLVTREPALRQP